MRFRVALPFVALSALILSPAAAQKRPTPEQRIDRLEKQVRQVQKRVFPKGQPADTAGLNNEPAATHDSVSSLNNRLDAVGRQMAEILRQSEENGNRVGVMEDGRLIWHSTPAAIAQSSNERVRAFVDSVLVLPRSRMGLP